MESFYDILEVSPSAQTAEIRASYLKLAREYHPDRVPEHLTKLRADAEEKVKQINEAWAVLSSPTKRRSYDLKLRSTATAQPPSWGVASSHRSAANPQSGTMGAGAEWLRSRRDLLRWGLIIATSTLVLVVIGELLALRGSKPSAVTTTAGQQEDVEPQRVLRYDLKPVQFQSPRFAGGGGLGIQLLSVALSERKTVVTFRVLGGDHGGALLYEPPGGSTRTRVVMGKAVVVDRGMEELYLVDGSGTKYYSTSGFLGGNQTNFDLYNFTRKISFTARKEVMLSAEFPPLTKDISAVSLVLPAVAKWQGEWRWPAISLK